MAAGTQRGRRGAGPRRGARPPAQAHARSHAGGTGKILAALLRSMPGAAAIVRKRDGTFIEVNARWEEQSGIARAKALGRTSLELGLWADLEQRARYLGDLDTRGSVEDRHVQFRRPDGTLREVLLSGMLVELAGESCIVAASRDVTAERRLRSTENMLASVFQQVSTPIAVSKQHGAIVEVNEAWERASGFTREAALGRTGLSLGKWTDPRARHRFLERVEAEGRVDNELVRFRRADGTLRDVLLSCVRIEWGGEPHWLWSSRDVTDLLRVKGQALQSERKYRASERKFAALFEDSPEPISLYRVRDGMRLAANAAWERVSGHSRDHAAGRPAMQMSLWPDPAARERLIDRVVAEGRISNVEQRLVRADGSAFDALISASCVDIDGERCVLWNWRDVSEQRRSERERSAADARYRALFETSVDAMVITSPQQEILDVNPATCAMSGYRSEELIGEPVSRLFSAEELAARPLRTFAPGSSWSVLERALVHKGGGSTPVEVLAGPQPDGRVLAIMRDITERKRNEQALLKSERRYRMLFDFARDLVVIRSPEGIVIDVNPAACAALGYRRDELVGRPVTTFFDPDELRVKPLRTTELLERPDTAPFHRLLRRKDGTPLHVENLGGPLPDGNLIVAMRDVTERVKSEAALRELNLTLERRVRERTAELARANEELAQANEALESYNFSISHDLRQPLNAIAGFAELLGAREGAAVEAECVREIEHNAARMEAMIDALLSLSRAGRGALDKTDVDMRDLAEAVLRDLSAAGALPERVSIGDLPGARGDRVLLQQVWANLIGNAVKYSRNQDTPRVEITGERRNGCAEYSVRDNGVGFDMRDATRVFDPFQRLPSGKSFEGSGVGLAIVQRIVRRHGGTISAESAPGQGATFRFSLPD